LSAQALGFSGDHCLAAPAFLMFVAYRGYSVILFTPVAAMAAVLG
jgi:hypothetical protein